MSYNALIKYGTIILALSGVIGGAYHYYTSTQSKLQEYAAEAIYSEVQIKQQAEVIEQQSMDLALREEIAVELNEQFAQSRSQVEELRQKFNKVSKLLGQRDLGKLAITKPKLIAKIITNGTRDALRCVEIASGSPLTEKEKTATKNSEVNNACPKLANPKYMSH